MTLFQHHLLGLSLTCLTTLGLGIFILCHNWRGTLHRSMAFYCFTLAWWSGWECAALQMPTRELSYLFMRIEYIGVAFIPTLFLTTVTYLLDFPSPVRKRILVPCYLSSIIVCFVATIFATNKFLGLSPPGPLYYLPLWGWAGPYYWPFMVFFFSVVIIGHFLVFQRWRISQGEERQRLLLFITSSLLAYLGGCPEFALKYGVRLGWLNPFGLYAFPFYITAIFYAIIQHQLFDIRVVIQKSLVYSILITLLTAGYFGLVYGIEHLFQNVLGYKSVWISLMAFAAMALLFQPLKGMIQQLIDWLIFRVPQEELIRKMERLEEQALQTEKFRAVSTMAAGMAHEIKNPLTALTTFTEFIPERHQDPEFAKLLHETFTEETQRIQTLVQDLLDFAKPKPPEMKSINIKHLVDSTMNLLSAELVKKQIQWAINCQHNGTLISADADQLRQVLINLIQNASDAMPKGGNVTIATRTNNGHMELTVADTGTGIPKELLPKIFDPFVTTKESGNGLGLAMVYSMVQAHRGTISVESEKNRGTIFTVRLPT